MSNASHQATPVSRRPFGQKYAFVVVAVIFVALLSSAALRATPGVLMLPLQTVFGCNVGVISSSAAIGVFLYGLAGPFAAAVVQRFGIGRCFFFARAPFMLRQRAADYRVINRAAKAFALFLCVVALAQASLVRQANAEPPDLSGVWLPDLKDQKRQETSNMPPWKAEILPQVQHLIAEEKAGRPFLMLSHCLPHGMPSWMLMTHNPFELLVTPGRITLLGEVDGNRMRRIYMDGRAHPEDPDLTLHGHSIGHWEGDTLVIDTNGIVPQAFIAISEAVGIPNNGDMHIVEQVHLTEPNVMHDDLEIEAPKVLTAPWKTTRIFRRYPDRHYEISEGECEQEDLLPGKDQYGNDIYVPNPQGAYGTVHTK